ncbi:hypothetical protein VAR608DRAFT_2023 [Variovorax sp. HW608]|uniref:hypothetical protein n=1 Tax=Variovorax sp. HW608 TaxID=1034889 RepID=UPI00081FA2DA|nr:hypothetical protein [Variovorax sp. HW608]SCK25212.1 hypothetical protein VAR608DRAFT_2023 [Variovorax sp. HW608]
MPNFYLPLSGGVRQEINPWTWFTRIANGQLGFININMGKSSDPGLEQQILDDVGSYGRQIGQLGDALEAVLAHMKTDTWEPEAQKAVDAFKFQLAEIRRLKRKRAGDKA